MTESIEREIGNAPSTARAHALAGSAAWLPLGYNFDLSSPSDHILSHLSFEAVQLGRKVQYQHFWRARGLEQDACKTSYKRPWPLGWKPLAKPLACPLGASCMPLGSLLQTSCRPLPRGPQKGANLHECRTPPLLLQLRYPARAHPAHAVQPVRYLTHGLAPRRTPATSGAS
jgi:hypothetical protein